MRRGLRASIIAGSLLFASTLSAQDADPLARLDSNNRYAFDLILDSAGTAGLPTQPLISKAQEGLAKKADGRRIVEAVRKLFNQLKVAHSVLGGVDAQEL